MTTYYCHANKSAAGWQSIGVQGIKGYVDTTTGLPEQLAEQKGQLQLAQLVHRCGLRPRQRHGCCRRTGVSRCGGRSRRREHRDMVTGR
jgi:hypothetical protein